MNALPKSQPETAIAAANRLFAADVAKGYKLAGLHRYNDTDGNELFRVVRLKHPVEEKVIRPMRRDGLRYVTKRPDRPASGWPLYVPPYPLVDSGPIVIVEGEGCADALGKRGIPATTSGGSSSASGADWTPLRGRQCVLWADHDEPGAKYMTEVAAKLHAIGCTVERIDVGALALPPKGDCVDWLAQHPDATAADVLALPRIAAAEPVMPGPSTFASAPEPLRRPLPPAPDYPLDALGPLLGDAARRIHDVVQAPAAICGQSILAAASLAVQAHADVNLSGSVEPLSLWHVTIAASGERKSAADRWALHAHYAHEKAQATQWQHVKASHDLDLTAYDAASRKAQKGKDRAAIREALEAIGQPPEAPLLPWLMLSEPTMEGLHKAFQFGQPSMGLFNDDAGDFLGGHAMNKDNRAKSAAGFSKLWDDGRFDRVRAGDGAAKYYGRRLALHLMVQPVIAEGVLSDDVLTGQGFLARCLLAWPLSTIGTRQYQDIDLSHDPALERYWTRMRDLLAAKPTMATGSRNELSPRVLVLTPDAMAHWIDVKDAIEAGMRGTYAGIHAWASKGGSQVARIAGVLTLAESPDAGVIQREAVERAAILAMYHLDEAARIVGTASVPVRVRHAELLRDWCRETGRTLLYSSDALRNGPNAIRTQDAFTDAVALLEETGWAQWIEGGAEIDGKRRAKVWSIRVEAEE